MGYRYIKLTSSEIEILEEASKTSDKQHIRRKCDTILLSDRGYDITSLANLYQVRAHTIRDWMNKWLSNGLNGISIAVGRGRKAEIDSSDAPLVDTIKSSIALNPQNLNTVCQELNQSNGMTLTKGKLIRFLKKN